jgi:hypothetical protein
MKMNCIPNHLSIVYRNIITFLIILVVSSCTNTSSGKKTVIEPTFTEDSWLTDKPCKAPCWYGMEPGKTSKEEAMLTTKELSFIDPEGVTDSVNGLLFNCKNYPGCVYMGFRDNILEFLNIYLYTTVTFKEVVDKLGNPDIVMIDPINPEGSGCYIGLLWLERQMEVRYAEEPGGFFRKDLCQQVNENNNTVPPDLTVQDVSIMQKEFMAESLAGNDHIPWNGFIVGK